MATWTLSGRSALNSSLPRCRGGKWSWLLSVSLAFLVVWLQGTLPAAQPPLEPADSPETVRPAPAAPIKVDSTLPSWQTGQAELLKPPSEVLKPNSELPKPPTDVLKTPCPPAPAKPPGTISADQCDQNVPGVACPSPKDAADVAKYVEKLVDPSTPLTLYHGRTRLMLLNETPIRVQIGGDEKIVDFALLGPEKKQLSLLGKTLGSTVLNLWFANPKDKAHDNIISYLVRVIPDPEEKALYEEKYKRLAKEINCTFPDSRVCLTVVGDKLVVSGQSKDVAEAAQILWLARSHAPRVEENVLPFSAMSVNLDPATTTRDRFRDLLEVAGPHVINQLRIPGEQQVMLKVTIAEINRAAARSIGLNFSINRANFQFANNTGNIAGLGGLGAGVLQGAGLVGNQGINGLNQVANNLPAVVDNGQVALAIDALRTLTYSRTLAEPTLTTLNGQPASFHNGGSFPVPTVTGGAQFGVQGLGTTGFISYGVQLNFTPYITDRDRVRLSVSAVVSARDQSTGTVINGAAVSGLTERSFQNVVELRQGQTLAVAGMIQNNLGAQANRIPFFGDLPIIGRALGLDQVNAGEQELVILITPELVHPLNNDEVSPLPGSDLFEPGDLEFYLLGRLESRRGYDYRSPVRTDLQRQLRYHRCEDLYIIGPSGHSEPAGSQTPKSK